MRSFLLTFFILLSLLSFCQDNETSLSESKRIKTLLDSAQKLIYTTPSIAIKIATECLTSTRSDFNTAKSYRIIGAGNYILGNYPTSKNNYLDALNYDLKQTDSLNIIKDYRGISINLGEQSNYDECFTYLNKALKLAHKTDNLEEAIEIISSKAVFYFHQKKYLKAVEEHNKVIKLANNLDAPNKLIATYYNLGAIYAEINKLDLALDYLIKGQKLAESANNKYYEGSFSSTMAGIYSGQEKNDLAILNYERSIEAFLDIQYLKGLAYSTISMAIIYSDKGDYSLSKKYAQEAFGYANSINDKVVLSLFYNLEGKSLLKEGNYKGAIQTSEKALEIARFHKDILREKEALEIIYKSYEKQLKNEKAFDYYKRFIALKDSLNNIETIEKMETIELKRTLQLAEKESKINKQNLLLQHKEQESEKSKLYLTIVVISALLLSIIFLYLFRIGRLKQEKEILSKNESLEKTESKLSKLALEKEQEQKEFLRKEISFKNGRIKELANIINQKNELLEDFSSENLFKDSKHLAKKINKLIDSKEERDLFNHEVKLIDGNFHQKLLSKFPDLTKNDLKIASMLKMGLSSKEMASLLSISSTSVDVSRSRFRKKINLKKEENLLTFLNNI